MKKSKSLILVFLVITFLNLYGDNRMIIYGGKILTMNLKKPFVSAVVVDNGKIVFAGDKEKAMGFKNERTFIIDLKGRTALPGFNDCHLHFLSGGKHLFELELYGLKKSEIIKKVKERVLSSKKGEWIIGRGWDQGFFKDKTFPKKEELDSVSKHNPVFLVRVDGHTAWVNSYALKIFGIDKKTKSPKGGEILKDKNGEPTGILKENALEIYKKYIPEPSIEDVEKYIESAIKKANSLGITSIQDMSDLKALDVYEKLLNSGKLTLRISFWGNFDKGLDYNLKLRERIEERGKGIIRMGIVKGFIDGTLGSRTAKMFKPYSDSPTQRGVFTIDLNEFFEKLFEYEKHGFQIGFHAIGDMGVWMVLNGYEAVYRAFGERDRRWRIEHSQTVIEDDLMRYKRYGVIASIQPSHLIFDLLWARERLGKEREKEAYRLSSFLKNKVNVCFGTDWPVSPLNPIYNLYSAVLRRDLKGYPAGGFNLKEGIELYMALYLYTYGSSYAEFEERRKGMISEGMYADIVVLSHDIFKVKPENLVDVKVDYTIFNGKVVYERK